MAHYPWADKNIHGASSNLNSLSLQSIGHSENCDNVSSDVILRSLLRISLRFNILGNWTWHLSVICTLESMWTSENKQMQKTRSSTTTTCKSKVTAETNLIQWNLSWETTPNAVRRQTLYNGTCLERQTSHQIFILQRFKREVVSLCGL